MQPPGHSGVRGTATLGRTTAAAIWSPFGRGRRIQGSAVDAALLATVLAAGAAEGVRAPDNADGAAADIEDVADAAVAELADPGLGAAERRRALNTLITEHFAVRDISRFVLARYWRTATDGEKQAFQGVFVLTLAQRFAPLFEGASEDAFEIVRAQLRRARTTC